MQETILNGESRNIINDNIEKIKSIFPEVFNEDKIDFEKLQNVLGNYIDTEDEKYRFTWNGKMDALRLSQNPSLGALRPCPEESKAWDTTQNIYIEGDNLEVLKLLQNSYLNQIKMIYIDPPYNTGNDFVYADNFKDNLQNYKEITGQVDSEGNATSTNSDSSGRYHTNWLNMMYPRLRLARNLLKDDGVIFISIGQAEVHNLIKICDEVFGEDNKLGVISRLMKSGGNKGRFFSPNIDYILTYAKNNSNTNCFRGEMNEDLINKVYNQIQKDGERAGEYYRSMGLYQSSLDPRPNQRYFIKCPDGTFVIPPGETMPKSLVEGEKCTPTSGDGVWRWIFERYLEEYKKGNIEFKETTNGVLIDSEGNPSKWNIYTKIWLNDRQDEGQIPVDIITKYENRHSSKEIQALEIPFDFAKPVGLIKYLIEILNQDKDITILDFFSGSATTAQACIQLNAEDGGSRKFIMVQLPEKTDEKSEAYKAGYHNICEIGKERIRKAGEQIKEEIESSNQQLKLGEEPKTLPDIGFKVFKLDTSNIKKWNPETKDIKHALLESIDNYVEGRTEEDVLYEIILKCGIDLTVPIQELNICDKKVYSVAMGALIICLDNNITQDVANEIARLDSEFVSKDAVTVVFKDNGFANDSVKTNIKETMRAFGIGKFVTV